MDALDIEYRGLKSDQNMTRLAIKSQQQRMMEMLKGDMGKDIDDVLSGKKKVRPPFWTRVKNWFKRLWN